MHVLPQEERDSLIDRLRKVEGQAKGIQRMIEDGRDCLDVINQLAAVKAAINAVSGELLEAYALRCLRHPEDFSTPERAVEQAVRALVRAGR
jgi:DNA-binding FrmR family transcriptional regulator